MTCIVACGLRIIMVNSRPISEQRHHKYEAIIGQGHEGIWQHMYFAISEGRVRISPLFLCFGEKEVSNTQRGVHCRARPKHKFPYSRAYTWTNKGQWNDVPRLVGSRFGSHGGVNAA
jgi:hypothetical protein